MKFDKPIGEVIYTGHAVQQMFTRRITVDEIREVLSDHEVLAEYLDDVPYPSRLLLGTVKERPLHVVLGYDEQEAKGYIVTAYEPDPALWEEGFRKRRG